jgi:hypothetical protein
LHAGPGWYARLNNQEGEGDDEDDFQDKNKEGCKKTGSNFAEHGPATEFPFLIFHTHAIFSAPDNHSDL